MKKQAETKDLISAISRWLIFPGTIVFELIGVHRRPNCIA
jgi:hypothetical protein